MHVLVMAKAPVPGRVKTRLCPPCSAEEAAGVAEAALADTLEAVSRCGADQRILALDGEPGDWLPTGFDVVAQRGSSLAERLTFAWTDARGPGVQIGMDTPQVEPGLLDAALAATDESGASLGLAADGGWWAIGLGPALASDPGAVFSGIPTSRDDTGARQLERLWDLAGPVSVLPTLLDVDRWSDALAVAALVPSSRFAAAVGGR